MMQHTTQDESHFLATTSRVLFMLAVAVGVALFVSPHSAHAVTAAEKQAEAEAAYANLMAMQESLDRLSAQYGEALSAQEEAEKKHKAAEVRIGEITEEIESVQSSLNEHAREMYRSGSVKFLEIVLGASSFEEFATSLDMANRVNQNEAALVDEHRALKEEAVEQEAILQEQAEVAAKKSEEAAAAEQQAQATVAEMDAVYQSLSAEAAELLEEERKAREAEEAARAAAVLEAARIAAEQEEAARAAQEAAEAEAEEEAEEDEAAEDESDESDESDGENYVDEDGDGYDDETGEEISEEEGEEGESDGESDDESSDENADDEESTDDEGDKESTDEAGDEEATSEEPSDDGGNAAPAYEGGSDTVSRAQACLSAPYVWGGVGPDGYDCSGLVSYCLTGSHTRLGTTVTFMGWPQVADPQPGDIAVNWGHTGVYIGGGQMIHAATYGVGVITGPVQDGMIFVRYPG